MSVSEFPATDSETRQERAEDVTIDEVREINGDAFDVSAETTVYEVDLTNERGETRENVVIIPRILFENTKDVQHRHQYGIVGKYTRSLCMMHDGARDELEAGIREKRNEIQSEIQELKERDSRLLHTTADMEL